MNIIDIITKKKNKEVLTKEEIDYFVNGYINNEIKDYQMSSLLMAIVINGMTEEETINLTDTMLKSGVVIDLSKINGIVVDKHSTGGIGDKTSLVVLPLAASLNVKIAKMSGRGLGFTGGTIDKLESISNFNVSIDSEKFINQVNDIGISLVSQSEKLVPADKKIYALRDVTGTTESIPLIASSIMSKKLASGASKILLDVKVGKGAFMKNIDDAKKLANLMVKIGNSYGRETVAILSNMDYPLGKTIGNALEVQEAIDTLDGKGEKNFLELCIHEAAYMVSLANNISIDESIKMVKENINNKKALLKFKEFVKAQGGDISTLKIANKIPVYTLEEGYISDIDSLELAKIANSLGAGRINKEDKIDYSVGIELNKLYGDKVEKGDILFYLVTDKNIDVSNYENIYKISNTKPNELKIIYDIIK